MSISRLLKFQRNINKPILIKKKENLLYLTGRSFMNGYLLVLPPSPKRLVLRPSVVFFGDGLEKLPGIHSDILKNVGMYLGRNRVLQLEDQFTFAEYNYIKRKVKSAKRKIKLGHARSPVDFQRQIKEPQEIALIQKSMSIVGKMFAQVKKQLKNRTWTEIRLVEFIKHTGFKLGASDVSFPPIVASGANAAIPHHVPSSKRLKPGESIIIDFGFKYKNYCSDFTRTVFLKRVPSRLERAYNQVEKAYNESIKFISDHITPSTPSYLKRGRGGVRASDVYQKALDVLKEKHLDKYFIHNLGHGAGLEIHELPNLSPNSKDVLRNGMVFSIEPGVYIPKLGGVRIEDLVYLTKGGANKFISQPTQLRENIL